MNKNIKVKVNGYGDYFVSVRIRDGIEVKFNECEAIYIVDCIAGNKNYTTDEWRFGFAEATDTKPERFGFAKGSAGISLSISEAKLFKIFLERYIHLVVDSKISRDIREDAPSEDDSESEEEALEKYPVTDIRNPLNLNYKA